MKNIKIACIGNYVPRQCGIATFTRDIVESITKNKIEKGVKADAYVVAMNDKNLTYDYPEIVKHVVRQENQKDYIEAAKFINSTDAEICVLQHEFGIFGGKSGIYILYLIKELKIPLIVTFHTVLKDPSLNEKIIIQKIGESAEKIVVMSKRAIYFLTEIYNVPKEKIELIEHGVPDIKSNKIKNYKKKLNLKNKKSLLTFGLLSRNKGIETVIQALKKIVKKHPDIIYIILGKTHPNVIKTSGEEHRNYLKSLVKENNLMEHVYFHDHYVTNEELFGYLTAIDIYITPYLNEAQITSGALSYAIGAGAAVISTPYWHAQEILADNRGKLFDFNDSNGLADILCELLDNPSELNKLRKEAYKYGRKTIWPEIGSQYLKLISKSIKSKQDLSIKKDLLINSLDQPNYSFINFRRFNIQIQEK